MCTDFVMKHTKIQIYIFIDVAPLPRQGFTKSAQQMSVPNLKTAFPGLTRDVSKSTIICFDESERNRDQTTKFFSNFLRDLLRPPHNPTDMSQCRINSLVPT
ncbi:hypothetical protein AVEN_247463-1 [Araneus ventricosus]|uniref:Uncharacterized protein n=1 Tax=Araneus ventricosus TaxID=182803 RepID=A0A4Y2DMY9_ARAVE|nr:hypothetical protein AVEN_247463-1 [Araneus ventricosus]